VILAADPGLTGALALYDGRRLEVRDMPTLTRIVSGKPRKALDEQGVHDLFGWARMMDATTFVIEQVNGMPGQSGPAAFTFGYGVGVLTACAVAHGFAIERVAPARWKAAMNCPADKRAARARASELLPAYSSLWSRQKDDGRAESSMLALWGWLTRGGAQ
jgi:crossover junction endodeoxyribonuclease RuvC